MSIESVVEAVVREGCPYVFDEGDDNHVTVRYDHVFSCVISLPVRGKKALAYLMIETLQLRGPDECRDALQAFTNARDMLGARGYEGKLDEEAPEGIYSYEYEIPFKSEDVSAILKDFYFP